MLDCHQTPWLHYFFWFLFAPTLSCFVVTVLSWVYLLIIADFLNPVHLKAGFSDFIDKLSHFEQDQFLQAYPHRLNELEFLGRSLRYEVAAKPWHLMNFCLLFKIT